MTPDAAALTPRRIVEELDRDIVGQTKAKRAVAVAIRNRVRRMGLAEELRADVHPKNLILIGATGVGKTEIARRLARLLGAPFVKVEATKFTEVGYMGRDVDSMVRDLAHAAVSQVRSEYAAAVDGEARRRTEESLLDALAPETRTFGGVEPADSPREQLRRALRAFELEARDVEVTVTEGAPVPLDVVAMGPGAEEMEIQVRSVLRSVMPERPRARRLTVAEARAVLHRQHVDGLLDMDRVVREGLRRAQEQGIIFLDELDKVAMPAERRGGPGPDVSREGVQRDLLPLIEGSTVLTKYGPVSTDHVLFIAAGAFHMAKPSDLIPELQGRFPIRVELEDLGLAELRRILTEPRTSLVRQYTALLAVDGVDLSFTDDGLDALAAVAHRVNQDAENLGARRLHTVMERLLEDVLFDAPDAVAAPRCVVDGAFVTAKLAPLLGNRDLARFIL